jgi:hypothetical protein
MPENQDNPKYPSIEEFESMTVPDKVRLFTGLPIPAQKLLIGITSFADSVQPEMARVVSKTSLEEFQEAQNTLSHTPFFTIVEQGRLQVAVSMRAFINTDLKQIWEQQKSKPGNS